MSHRLHRCLVACLVLGLNFFGWRPSPAHAVNYSEDWTVTSWRVAKVTVRDNQVVDPALFNPPYPQTLTLPYKYCLGPAEWSVTGQIDGRNYTETWTGTGWLDTTDGPGLESTWRDDGLSLSYENSNTCDNPNGFAWRNTTFTYSFNECHYAWVTWVCNWVPRTHVVPNFAQVVPTGLYGGLLAHSGGYSRTTKVGRVFYKSGIRSIPTSWQVVGGMQ